MEGSCTSEFFIHFLFRIFISPSLFRLSLMLSAWESRSYFLESKISVNYIQSSDKYNGNLLSWIGDKLEQRVIVQKNMKI